MTVTATDNHEIRRRELREFLMARRTALSPELVGITRESRRRARGLRREELAGLAGVGLTWYTWLEQGRRINVSAETLERISKALQLSPSDTTYLFSLAGIPRFETAPLPTSKDLRLQAALDGFVIGPAFVVGTFWDVEAFNDLADGLFRFDGCSGPFARNHIWRLFMDPQRRSIYTDWPAVARLAVGALRGFYPLHVDNVYLRTLIDALREGSEEFRRLWSQYTTTPLWPVSVGFTLPQHGELQFTSLRFRFMGQQDRVLVLIAPETPRTVAAMTRIAAARNRTPGSARAAADEKRGDAKGIPPRPRRSRAGRNKK